MGETTTALTVAQAPSRALEATDYVLEHFDAMLALAEKVHGSGLLPYALAKSGPGGVLAVMAAGRELGMGAMEAVRSLQIVEGNVCMKADAQLARAISLGGVDAEWHHSDAKSAKLTLHRGGRKYTAEWTIEMAQRPGYDRQGNQTAPLASKGVWKQHPEAMLRARAITTAIRAFCPDVLGSSVYDPEELEPVTATSTPTPTTTARREPEPVAAEVVPAAHHLTWDRDRARFCAVLGELGLRYEDVADYTAAHGQTGQRPSAMTTQGRDRLLDGLRAGGAAKVAAWVAERAVTPVVAEREPGEEG